MIVGAPQQNLVVELCCCLHTWTLYVHIVQVAFVRVTPTFDHQSVEFFHQAQHGLLVEPIARSWKVELVRMEQPLTMPEAYTKLMAREDSFEHLM